MNTCVQEVFQAGKRVSLHYAHHTHLLKVMDRTLRVNMTEELSVYIYL